MAVLSRVMAANTGNGTIRSPAPRTLWSVLAPDPVVRWECHMTDLVARHATLASPAANQSCGPGAHAPGYQEACVAVVTI